MSSFIQHHLIKRSSSLVPNFKVDSSMVHVFISMPSPSNFQAIIKIIQGTIKFPSFGIQVFIIGPLDARNGKKSQVGTCLVDLKSSMACHLVQTP